jgi:glycosyltransferase involved in cell wall biosynthesis
LYEAMACGVPILAAMEGAGAQILEESHAGAAVPCGDVSGLARVLGEVLDRDGLRAQYSEAARRYAETHFDANRVVAAYEQVLLSAIGERV